MTTIEKIRAEIENIKDFEVVNGGLYVRQYDVAQIIDKYTEQEPIEVEYAKQQKAYNEGFEDCRKAVIKAFQMFRGYEANRTNAEWVDRIETVVGKLPSVNPQEPCDDAISRQAVLDIINFEDKWLLDAKGHNANTEIAFSGMKSRVSNLPPVRPQEQTGHWIMPVQDDGMSDPIYYQVRCSKCGFDLDPQTWHMELHQYGADKYCPKCGSKMYEDKGVLEQLAEKQNNLSATNKAWSDVIEKNGYVN